MVWGFGEEWSGGGVSSGLGSGEEWSGGVVRSGLGMW